jgi:hypothetical protein
MLPADPRRRRSIQWLIGAGVVLLLFALSLDDWGRDFTGTFAEISADAPQEELRPFASRRSADELTEAVRWAAVRIKNWEYVGDTQVDQTTTLVFVRTSRILRFKDDIIVRIEDRGGERVVTAASKSRSSLGDLGRNPRNLRRLLIELQDVLDGSSNDPAPMPTGGLS